MMKNPHIIWASVVIVFMMIGGAVVLSALGKDLASFTNLVLLIGIPVLGAMGVGAYQQISTSMDQVKEVNNGRMTDMLTMIKDLHAQVTSLALRIPVDPPVSPAPTNTDTFNNDDTSPVLLRTP